jgi:hypothetical protein
MIKKCSAAICMFLLFALPFAHVQAADPLNPKSAGRLKPPCERGHFLVGSGESARCATRTEFTVLRTQSEQKRAKRLANRTQMNVTRRTAKLTRARYLHGVSSRTRDFGGFALRKNSNRHDVPMIEAQYDPRQHRALQRGLSSAVTRRDWSAAARQWTRRTRTMMVDNPRRALQPSEL